MDERTALVNFRDRIRRGLKKCEDGALLRHPDTVPPSPDFVVHRTLQMVERELTKIVGDSEDVNDLSFPGQREWKKLCEKHGEEKAKKLVARKLRAFADQIESPGYPMIFGIHLDTEREGFKELMEGIEVTLSHPWPG